MFYRILISVCGFSAMFSGCSIGKETQNSTVLSHPTQLIYVEEDTMVVFVIMKIYTDSLTNTNKILVKEKIYTTGHLKVHAAGFANTGSYITCFLYDGDKLLDSMRVEHPLHRNAEYFDENHKMGMKEIHQKEGEFSVRFQLKGKGNRIKVLETLNENKAKELTMIQL